MLYPLLILITSVGSMFSAGMGMYIALVKDNYPEACFYLLLSLMYDNTNTYFSNKHKEAKDDKKST